MGAAGKARQHWALPVRLDGVRLFLAWFTDDTDGFLCADDGELLVRRHVRDLAVHLRTAGLRLSDEAIPTINLDGAWKRIRAGRMIPREILDVWNFLTDLAVTAEYPKAWDVEDDSRLYNKIFFACNVPATTPPGRRFRPVWSDRDRTELRCLLRRGRAMTRSVLRRCLRG